MRPGRGSAPRPGRTGGRRDRQARAGRACQTSGRKSMLTHVDVDVQQLWRDYRAQPTVDRKSTRLNSSHANISYAVFCLKKKKRPRTAPKSAQAQPARERPHELLMQRSTEE